MKPSNNTSSSRQADRATLTEQQRQEVHDLASDFPRLWRDKRTPQRERKRMVRLLIEDVTLVKAMQLDVHVRFRGGATRSLSMPVPEPSYKSWQTDPEVVALIDRLLDEYTTTEVAAQLNERGLRSGKGGSFTADHRGQYLSKLSVSRTVTSDCARQAC